MTKTIEGFSKKIKLKIIETAHDAGNQGVHIGGALSCADILAVLYGRIMKYDTFNPKDPDRDRLILSKGHDCLGLYAALNVAGFISDEELKKNFLQDDGFLPTHPVKNIEKGIECSSGSLGMGLAFGVGEALAAKKTGRNNHIFVIMGDGECDEGSCWEAFMAAAQYKLDNILVFLDKNGLQSDGATKDIMCIDYASALKALGWNVVEADGHNINMLYKATLSVMECKDKPSAIVADTIKGKGVSFMENNNAWHHGHMTEEQYQQAMEELRNGNQ
jgi:transketolase